MFQFYVTIVCVQGPHLLYCIMPHKTFLVECIESIHFFISRSCDTKATRARITMMPIGTPRVPYRNVTEGTWQWVDLWNALVSQLAAF